MASAPNNNNSTPSSCSRFNMVSSFFLILSLLLSVSAIGMDRKLSTELFCPLRDVCKSPDARGSYTNVAHTTADGPHNTLHYIYSSLGLPTLLVARTPHNSLLKVDWDAFLSSNYSDIKDSISFSKEPDYAYALVFTKLYEYNDLNDTADMQDIPSNASLWVAHDLSEAIWDDSSLAFDAESHTMNFSISTNSSLQFKENGSLSFTLLMEGKDIRHDVLPHLAFNPNTTQFDVRLIGLDPVFDSSRFGLEIILVTSLAIDTDRMDIKTHSSIDDEHSPGTFKMLDWTSEGDSQTTGAFVQWKPVCYLQPDYKTRTASKATHYGLQNSSYVFDLDNHPHLLSAFFGDKLEEGSLGIKALNVSYGIIGDKFYARTSYTAWMFSVGSGLPPSDQVSLLVICVISIGLGIPVLLIITGGITVCCKRRKDKQNEMYSDITTPYTPINQ